MRTFKEVSTGAASTEKTFYDERTPGEQGTDTPGEFRPSEAARTRSATRSRWRAVRRLILDPYLLAILGTVGAATLLPAGGVSGGIVAALTQFAVAVLFFLYGARLPRQAIFNGMRQWRLHATVLSATFLVFPVLGLALSVLVPWLVSPPIYAAILYLCTLPSALQSSIAFTSTARGNVAAAICSASLSSLVGLALTPMLVLLLVSGGGSGVSTEAIIDIVLQLLLPFLLGQFARRWIGEWLERRTKLVGIYDKSVILLLIYSAFSGGVTAGLWNQIAPGDLVILGGLEMVLLAAILVSTHFGVRWLGFEKSDRTAILFCGSKKSLSSGLTMANILFTGASAGVMALPMLLYQILQVFVCAALAQKFSREIPHEP